MASIKNQLVRAAAVGVLGVATMAGSLAPALAGTASSHSAVRYAAVRSLAAKPNSNITGSGKKVNYSPKSLSAKWSGPTEKKCTAAKESFTISNKAKSTETVTLSGKAFAKIPAGKVLGVCAWGKGTATGKFGLAANKKAVLTVHVS